MELGLGKLACFGQSAAQVGLRVGVVWTQADGGAIVLNRLEEFTLRDKSICQIVVRIEIVWLRAPGAPSLVGVWRSLGPIARD